MGAGMILHLKSGRGSHLQNAVQTSAVIRGCFDCSYPLDVARRNMQLSMMYPEMNKFSKGLLSTLVLTFREHGVSKGLYRGMTVNYVRAIPMVAVSFSTYELMKQLLGLDTGLDS
ncbi:hypothetical protein HPB47_023872 [Ixodes persulcatus]|uniref:Uncharacterized protein n=1 Tax=Ixodes persulcatus TaxID=34615 RepID=A0AC60Q896_IXOPE|nr:hypothetical protein HPB47_023872 [Ixodes persulcatus]